MKTIVILAFSLSGLAVLIWPLAVFGSIFLFDASSAPHTWITAFAVWTYPVIWGSALACAIVLLRRRPKATAQILAASVAPFVPIVVVMCWHA